MASEPPTRRDYLRMLPVALACGLAGSVVAGVVVGKLAFGVIFGLLMGLGMWLFAIAISRWAWRKRGTV
jgi:hypothetical protein